ncbi:GntR family transcriptional regulator [Aquabacter spiritensis]|uniref:GntR family transcriptional regulator n=1 Tax=Aquabacter spiritensis TaxID=933073 RepID=A0A4R3M1H9_9HYPH|nr:GntR family transcriptional regulator [Aquabacter spiritensis]TCT05007.1 GntR family transcriptional regulator [Aquabacter spiritensis]
MTDERTPSAGQDTARPMPPDTGVSRAQWVYETLRDGIRLGTWRRGERVREETVARALGVSRTPVREALSRLQARGLLEVTAAGLVVATIARPQTLELYAMREVLEGSAARFAAQHAAPSEIASLTQLSGAFAEAVGDPARLAALNRQFHAAIQDAAHNRYLVRMLEDLGDALALLPGTTFELPERGRLAVAEHAAILAGIAQRDPDAAEQAARAHIRRAQEARLDLMQRAG